MPVRLERLFGSIPTRWLFEHLTFSKVLFLGNCHQPDSSTWFTKAGKYLFHFKEIKVDETADICSGPISHFYRFMLLKTGIGVSFLFGTQKTIPEMEQTSVNKTAKKQKQTNKIRL